LRDIAQRTPKRDMEASSLARVLEIFFGGNTNVDAVVLFDSMGETIDYHSYIDPYSARLIAAHCGIIFDLTRYKLAWLGQAKVEMVEISAAQFDIVTCAVCEEYLLVVVTKSGTEDAHLLDSIMGSIEVLRREIGC